MNKVHTIFPVKLTVLLIALCAVLTVLWAAPEASALSRTYFDDTGEDRGDCDVGQPGYSNGRDLDKDNYNAEWCDPDRRVVLLAGENKHIPEERTVLQANFFNGSSTNAPRGQTLTIRGIHLCAGNPGAVAANNRDNVTNGYYSDNRAAPPNAGKIRDDNLYGKDVTRYRIGLGNNSRDFFGRFQRPTNADCGVSPDRTISLRASDFERLTDAEPGWWYVVINVRHINQHGRADECDKDSNSTGTGGPCDGLVNSFKVTADGADARTVTTYSTNEGCTDEINGGKCVTIRSARGEDNMDYAHHLTFKLRFGSDCTVPAGGDHRFVNFYDLDYGEADGGRHIVKLTIRGDWPEEQSDGSIERVVRWWWNKPGAGLGWHPEQPSYRQSIQVPSRNAANSRLGFWSMPDGNYTAFVMNVGPHLAMQAGLPFDGIFYEADCGESNLASLTPHANLNLAAGQNYEGGDTANGTTYVNNSSSTTGHAKWHRYFWYEDNGNDQYDASPNPNPPGDALIVENHSGPAGQDFPAGDSLNNSSPSIAIDGSKKRICVSLTLNEPSADTSIPSPGRAVDCRNIERRPYLQVLNGDVNTTKDDVRYCTGTTDNKISTYWRLKNGTTPQGSGTQIAAYAGGDVVSFVSAALRNSPPMWEKGLTFANTSGAFGISFGTPVGCNSDPDWTRPDNTPGANQLSGSFSGTNIKVYSGNLHITGNVNYSTAGNFDLDNKPYLKVVVQGDIYVDSSVTHLDGIYMATGTIYTCTNGAAAPPLPSLMANCNNRLTVTGSLVANKIKFLRLAGGLNSNNPAETITYDPLNWIPAPGADNGVSEFDSYTIMPPIL